MRAMLSFTTCGGLAMPCARTVGACMASASPTAVVSAEAANIRRFMRLPLLLASRCETNDGRFDGYPRKVSGRWKNSFLPVLRLPVYFMRAALVTTEPGPDSKWLYG